MLFVFRNYDVQINEVGVKIMEHCYHNSPLPTCGISAATTTLTETQAKTTTKKATKVHQQRYASLQHLLDNRRQIVLRGPNFNNNIIINNNNDDVISYTTRDIQSNIKKKKKQRLTPSVLQLHQGSLFKKKFIGYSPQQKQLHYLPQTASERREFLAWHLSSMSI